MRLFGSTIEMPPGWTTEEVSEGIGCAHYQAPEGSIDLAYYELLTGILLTDINLSCSALPASIPLGPHLATVNWCAQGRCEVDLGEQGSLVVSKGALCLSSSFAQSFSYPTGTYRGFEVFVDLDRIDDTGWSMLAKFGLDRPQVEAGLFPAGLGINLTPSGRLAQAVESLEAELALDGPRSPWLLLRVCELLMLLVELDMQGQQSAGSYLQRSQRDMAQAVYQHIMDTGATPESLATLAEGFGVSEASLRAYFTRVYGESPASFARRKTLNEAARLLSQTNIAIADIGQSCGYANPSKFSAAFRRLFGVNPLEYRRRSRLG